MVESMTRTSLGLILIVALGTTCKQEQPSSAALVAKRTPVEREDEPHLRNLRQLTFGGENAEAYWNLQGSELILQSRRDSLQCDQIFRMNADGSHVRMVSTGKGRTTCSFIQTDGSILYASTHGHDPGCLWKPDRSQGYVWALYPEMDIWRADANGENPEVLFASAGYDAEATICPRDGRILFTSSKDGDLELYVMDRDGKNLTRLTHTPGYDGGAFFSPDCSKIVWRASRPKGEELDTYRVLLEKSLVKPSKLDIFMINVDGSGEERITHNPTFDGFPMWSHDGKKLVFASNRNNRTRGETNVFVADWLD
jgi:Tol biopolymer transport system component